MPVFQYKAIELATNKSSEGRVEAQNVRAAKELLREQGKIPTKIEEEIKNATVGSVLQQVPILNSLLTPRISMKSLNIMTQQLATLIDAGIPLIESLYLLEQQAANTHIKEVLKKVRGDVIAGDSFSVALSRFPNDFPKLYTNLIKAGEMSGELDNVCHRLAELLDKYIALQRKVTGAMIYPAVTLLVIVGVIIVILVVVVPQFQGIFSQNGAELPLPTKILINVSNFTTSFWWALILATSGFVFWFNMFRLGPGKAFVDQWLLTIPVLGNVFKKVYISRFTRTLGTILGAGVSLTEGISASAGTIDNYVLKVAFDRARDSLMTGGGLSRPLEQSKMFPLMVVKMIAVAEETGEMEKMLSKSSDFLDTEVDTAVETLTTLIEPLMIIVLGGILLCVALALYIPLFDMGKVVAGH